MMSACAWVSTEVYPKKWCDMHTGDEEHVLNRSKVDGCKSKDGWKMMDNLQAVSSR